MDLSRQLENTKLHGMEQSFSDDVWSEFHNATLNPEDLSDYLFEFIETQVIYISDCEEILKGNSEYLYNEHDCFGKPNSIEQAAFAVVYDYLTNHVDTVTVEELEAEYPMLEHKLATR